MYPDAVSPVPAETGYNGQSLGRASSIRETPYANHDSNGFISNGYSDSTTNGGSVTASSNVDTVNGYNGNRYAGTGYNENGSIVSFNGNGSTVSGYSGNGYSGNESSGMQFVRRRLLPAIPTGETHTLSF